MVSGVLTLLFDEADIACDIVEDDQVGSTLLNLKVGTIANAIDIHTSAVVDERAALVEIPRVGLLDFHLIASGEGVTDVPVVVLPA